MLVVSSCLDSDAFAKLLESGDLKASSVKLEGVVMPFPHLLARICFHHHFSGTRTQHSHTHPLTHSIMPLTYTLDSHTVSRGLVVIVYQVSEVSSCRRQDNAFTSATTGCSMQVNTSVTSVTELLSSI